ncbi:DDT domain-containing protein DDR4 isoform X2 [Zea mays]|uniref:DDT domain-containing protein DDR4 isoform X2 n=1 Tax=Zea mays TaxID=4577 RepID=UPI0004DEB7D0|nr:DDT domain-containing protein DDR4 isoform X2 [Zea mays]|eukprot:XP_008665613.1 DDT domain-containing protein DDR4 isoform X2 [Zea mays]
MAAASPPQDQQQPAAEGAVAREDPAALTPRRARFPRACHYRPNAPPLTPTPAPSPPPPRPRRNGNAGYETPEYRVVTPLVEEPASPAELPRWRLRGMWELASVLNFLHVFRPLLNIPVEFTAEELEDAIITPNGTLDDVHMPLLKSIPPVTRMAMGRGTWIAVLCKKLKHWWHWVAEGDIPIVASHGAETELYKALEPGIRLVILKAICDIRSETPNEMPYDTPCEMQEDVRNFIDSSLKHGYHLSIFRKERIGGDSHGISYWYEDDPILGHRLYREIRRVEHAKDSTKKSKGKGVSTVPVISYNWEAVASNFDEFKVAAEKLFSSRNRTEVSLGKKLKFTYLPEIEKIHKKKEKLLKKQQREAILLDSCLTVNGLTSGRSRRERKHVTYTFDDYERSINEAIKTIRKNENAVEVGPSPLCKGFYGETPEKLYYKAKTDEGKAETLHRSYRQRKRSQRYTKDYVEAISDIDLDFDSDDDIMGEAVYDEEYLRRRKRYKASLSENDDEFQLDQVANDGDDEVGTSLNVNEDTKDLQWYKRFPLLTPQGTKLKSIDEIQTGIRRSKRSTRSRINYRQLDTFGANTKYGKSEKCNASDPDASSDALNDTELSTSQDREEEDGVNKAQQQYTEKPIVPVKESRSVRRKFLVLNELVPIAGFDDASVLVKDKHVNNNGGKCSAAH